MSKRKEIEGDDGRVIAPMNVDGMPWYVKNQPSLPQRNASEPEEKLNFVEKMAFLGGILKAVLLVGGVFVGVYTIVILLMYFLL